MHGSRSDDVGPLEQDILDAVERRSNGRFRRFAEDCLRERGAGDLHDVAAARGIPVDGEHVRAVADAVIDDIHQHRDVYFPERGQ